MSKYPGYPQYIIAAFPKCGTKTINKVFTELGYKVFDVMQMNDYATQVSSEKIKKTIFSLKVVGFQYKVPCWIITSNFSLINSEKGK